MNNELATKNALSVPRRLSSDEMLKLNEMLSHTHPDGGGIYSTPADRALSTLARSELSARRRDLVEALAPAGKDRVRAALATVLAVFPRQADGLEVSGKVLDVYCAALADLPPWAINETCMAAVRGEVGSSAGRFMPTSAEMHLNAKRRVGWVMEEEAMLKRVLQARVEKPRPSAEARRAAVQRAREIMMTAEAEG